MSSNENTRMSVRGITCTIATHDTPFIDQRNMLMLVMTLNLTYVNVDGEKQAGPMLRLKRNRQSDMNSHQMSIDAWY